MTPEIAIPQMGNSLFRRYMKSKYVKSIQRSGGIVRWIELEDPDAAVKEALQCDGLLLPGGPDIAPALYGQEPTEQCGKPNMLRDRAEPQILTAFLETGKPIFCICRGAQMLNVFFGGTLHQDIRKSQTCCHSDFRTKNTGTHSVFILPGTKLSAFFSQSKILVNSLHHQAVDQIGKDLVVSASSEDGFVEALEHSSHPFLIGVQWHPEHMSFQNKQQQTLFDRFVCACKGE